MQLPGSRQCRDVGWHQGYARSTQANCPVVLHDLSGAFKFFKNAGVTIEQMSGIDLMDKRFGSIAARSKNECICHAELFSLVLGSWDSYSTTTAYVALFTCDELSRQTLLDERVLCVRARQALL
jgi:hypothetical protein